RRYARTRADSVGVSGSPHSGLQHLVPHRHAGTAGCGRAALCTRCRDRRGRMQPHATPLGPLLQRFFVESLCTQKRASPHTIARDRDTCRLLLELLRDTPSIAPAAAGVADLAGPVLLAFLDHL